MMKLVSLRGGSARRRLVAFAGSLIVYCVALCATFASSSVPAAATSSAKGNSLCATYASTLQGQTAISLGNSPLAKAYEAATKAGAWPGIQKATVAEFKQFSDFDKTMGSALAGAPSGVKSAQSTIIKFDDSVAAAAMSSTSNAQFTSKFTHFQSNPALAPSNKTVKAYLTQKCPGGVPTTGGSNSGSSSSSGGSGSSSASAGSLTCPSAAQVGSALGVAITAVKTASSPCDYTGPAANPLITVDYGSGASRASADASAHSQNLTPVSGVGVDAYKGVNGGTTTVIALDSHGNQVVVDIARNVSQGPGAGDASGAEALATAVLAG
jgi:hypothetical protein